MGREADQVPLREAAQAGPGYRDGEAKGQASAIEVARASRRITLHQDWRGGVGQEAWWAAPGRGATGHYSEVVRASRSEVTETAPASGRKARPTTGASPANGSLHEEIEGRLRRRGLRYTDGRRAIVELLIAADHPVHIGEIAKALPEMPRSSAYRHLADLQAASIVRDLPAGDDYARFELVEDLTEHHHHLLCTSCGRVIDVPASPELETALRAHLDGLARQAGFRPEHHRVDVFGRCDRCS